MPFIQNSFIYGQRQTNDIGGREYSNSVSELVNWYVLKNGSIKRRPGTELIQKLSGDSITDIKKVLRLKEHFIKLKSDGTIRVYRAGKELDIQAETNTIRDYSLNNTLKNLPVTYSEDRKLVGIKDIFLVGDKIWATTEDTLPFTIDISDDLITISPYYLTKKNLSDYYELVRSYPIKPKEVEVDNVFFDSDNNPLNITPSLVVSATHDLDTHRARLWLGVPESDRDKVNKIDTQKMALSSFIDKPLYFSVLPDELKIIGEGTTGFWDEQDNYTDGVLKNLNAQAGLKDFSYDSPTILGETKADSKTTAIKELLYGRRYMCIPKSVVIPSGTEDKDVYNTVFPAAEITANAVKKLKLTPEDLSILPGDDKASVTSVELFPEQVGKEYEELDADKTVLNLRNIPLLGMEADRRRDDYDFQFGVVDNGGRLRIDGDEWSLSGDDFLEEDNTTSSSGLFFGNEKAEITSVEIISEVGDAASFSDFDTIIRIKFLNNILDPLVGVSNLKNKIRVSARGLNWPVKFANATSNSLTIGLEDGNEIPNIGTSPIPDNEFIGTLYRIQQQLIRADDNEDVLDDLYDNNLQFLEDSGSNLSVSFDITLDPDIAISPNPDNIQPIYGVFSGEPENDKYIKAGNLKFVLENQSFDFLPALRVNDDMVDDNFNWLKGFAVENEDGTSALKVITSNIISPQTLDALRFTVIYKDTNTADYVSEFLPIHEEFTETYFENNIEFGFNLGTFNLFRALEDDLVSKIKLEFTSADNIAEASPDLITFPIIKPASIITDTVLARGISRIPDVAYIFGGAKGDSGIDDLKVLNQGGSISSDSSWKDVLAFGWHKTHDDKFVWFLNVKKTENVLENETTLKLSIKGGSDITLTKQDRVLQNTISFQSAKLDAQPTIPSDPDISIKYGNSDTEYAFINAKTTHREAKVYAECEIYEIGMPSPAKKDSLRVIGGNDFNVDHNTFTKSFFSSVDLNFKDVKAIGKDVVLANDKEVCRLFEQDKANNVRLLLSSALNSNRNELLSKVGYSPGLFNNISSLSIYSYLNKGGSNLSSLLTSDQKRSIEEYLSYELGNQAFYYSSLEGLVTDVTISSLSPHFNLSVVYVSSNKGIFQVDYGNGSISQVSQQISLLKPVIFTNKLVYFNTDNLLVSQLYSRERLGSVENFSGSAQDNLIKDVVDMQYDRNKNLYYMIRSDGSLIHATDFDTNIEGWGMWEFPKIGNEYGLKVSQIFLDGSDVFMVCSYMSYNERTEAYEDKLGIFKLRYDNVEDLKGVATEDGEPVRIRSRLVSNSYVGGRDSLLGILTQVKINKFWLNSDGIEKTRDIIPEVFVGVKSSSTKERMFEYTRYNEITDSLILKPIDFMGLLGYNSSCIIETRDFNHNMNIHGFVLGGRMQS